MPQETRETAPTQFAKDGGIDSPTGCPVDSLPGFRARLALPVLEQFAEEATRFFAAA